MCRSGLEGVRSVPETTPRAAAGSEDTAGELVTALGLLFQTLSSAKDASSERPTLLPWSPFSPAPPGMGGPSSD